MERFLLLICSSTCSPLARGLSDSICTYLLRQVFYDQELSVHGTRTLDPGFPAMQSPYVTQFDSPGPSPASVPLMLPWVCPIDSRLGPDLALDSREDQG